MGLWVPALSASGAHVVIGLVVTVEWPRSNPECFFARLPWVPIVMGGNCSWYCWMLTPFVVDTSCC